MKKVLTILIVCCFMSNIKAQSYEVQRLLLDVEKLNQMKGILDDMKQGYEVLTQGYEAVKNISEGNFNLHEIFLDNLLKVSPVVQNYKKVADIINYQLQLTKEYSTAYKRFKLDGNFTTDEIGYIANVYDKLINESLENLEDLTGIVTDGLLRMNDDERLERIDRLHTDMLDKLTFLRHFNNNTSVLSLQRSKAKNDISTLQNLYGVK